MSHWSLGLDCTVIFTDTISCKITLMLSSFQKKNNFVLLVK